MRTRVPQRPAQYHMFVVLVVLALSLAGPEARSSILEANDGGAVDWEGETIAATAKGCPPRGVENPGLAFELAVETARTRAYAALAEIVHGVQVQSETTVADSVGVSQETRTTVEGLIRGAHVSKIEEKTGGCVEVTLLLPITGTGQLVQAFIPCEEPVVIRGEAWKELPPCPAVDMPRQQKSWTGIIIDASSIRFRRCALLPRVYDTEGRRVFGPEDVIPDVAGPNGLVRRVPTIEEAMRHSRVSDNPLVIEAVRATGDAGTDIVIPSEMAEALQEARVRDLLRYCKVVLVLNVTR